MKVLEQFPAYLQFRERTRGVKERSPAVSSAAESEASPQDLIEQAVAESRAVLEADLLKRALALSPTGFEDLVLALIDAMGYGKQGSVERTSTTGDAGVDGIISQDPLGLDRIYMQAKRYATDRVIDRPRIHEFAGALLGKQGDRGVYITTSSFSRGAREEADRLNARIELIDGERLAKLLVEYGVGVQPESVVTLHRVDEDFFEGL
jgi:restriction system protein